MHRSKFPFAACSTPSALLPRAVPGMIAGIGIFYVTVLVTPLGWLRETLVLVDDRLHDALHPARLRRDRVGAVAIDQQLDGAPG